MEHRHLSNSSQILETDNDEGRNNSEHTYVHFASSGASAASNCGYPAQNTVIDGGNLELQLNRPPNSDGLLSGARTSEYTQYQQQHQPTYNPFLHASASGNNSMGQEHYASSSSYHSGQTSHGTDGVVMDFRNSRRGPYKRKRHEFQGVSQGGSTSRYCDTGSSSSVSMSADSRHEKLVEGTHHPPWDFTSNYGGQAARSRTSFGCEGNSSRAHGSSDPTLNSMVIVPNDSSMLNFWGPAPNMLPREQNHSHINSAPHSRPFLSDSGVFGPENPIIVADSNNTAALEMAGYHGEYSFHLNLVPRSVQVNPSQTVRGIRNTYHQRSATGMRAPSSNLHPRNMVSSDESLPVFSHGYAGRHSRSHPASVARDRSGRPRMSVDRFRALSDDVVVHNQLAPEGLVIMDRSAYGSRSLLDQHMDMRLDIDNMTYEDLLALGERIGNVNTGVSEDLISKCLTESIFWSDQPQEEGRCVICLEEYKNMDDVGTLKLCGHDFHVQCIRKWLAVKNNCPICKSCSLDDKMKNS